MKRWLACCLVLAALMMAGIAMAEGDFPELNAEGFLDSGEFVYENEAEGVWRYCSDTLRVEIIRYSQAKPKLTWFEAEVFSRDGTLWHMIPADPENRWKGDEYPYKITRINRTVLAINSDYAQLRMKQKSRVGIIIRAGEIISSKTSAKNKGSFPNLDTLAIFPDGNMEVFWSDELKPEEYLEKGASDVLAFGPWMIRDGERNEAGLKKYGTSRQPRAGIGMEEPGHYWAIMVEGRSNRSSGTSVAGLADLFMNKNCTVAFNLDGGQTSTMVFMGRQICEIKNEYNRRISARRTAEILGIGQSELVASPDDPF